QLAGTALSEHFVQIDGFGVGGILLVHASFGTAIEDENTDAAVGVGVGVFHDIHRRRHTLHTAHLGFVHAAGNQLAARRVRTIGRQLPVGIFTFAGRILTRVGVAGDGDGVRHAIQHGAELTQDDTHLALQLGAAGIEHRTVFAIENLHAQPVD